MWVIRDRLREIQARRQEYKAMFARRLLVALLHGLALSSAIATVPMFKLDQYTVSESDRNFMVCVSTLNQTLGTTVQFVIVDDQGTATRNEDYLPLGVFGSIQNTSFCFNLSEYIINDSTVEGSEMFIITVVNTDSRDSAQVVIADDDGATFQLVNTVNDGFGAGIFSVVEMNENITLPVCAELIGGGDPGVNGPLNREAVLLITTVEGAADSTDFLVVSNKTLTFNTGSTNSLSLCEEVIIFGDILPEDAELFTLSVITANPLDVIEGPTSSTVIIQNDDATPDCGQPPSPGLRGVVSYNSTLFEAVAVYSCEVGYSLEPSEGGTRLCQLSGRWSGVDPVCIIVDCGALTSLSYGEVSVNETTFGASAVYTCNSGFLLQGNRSRTCQADGNWSTSEPQCKAVDCGQLPAPENGLIDGNLTTFNNTASYSCDTGYELVGDQTRTCLASGNWSGSQPSCDVVDCGPLEPLSQGQVLFNTTTYLSSATYSCDAGYTNTSKLVRVCETSGQWSGMEPNCTDIDECETEFSCSINTNCSNTVGGFTCSCLDGFQGDGQVCEDINECVLNVTNCSQRCENGIGSFQCVCEAGYMLANDSTTCLVVDCGILTSPLNGLVSVNQTSFNAMVLYGCRYGYQLLGNSSRTCLASGEWSNSEPQCEVIQCGELNPPQNGAISLSNNTFFDSVATYSCIRGYGVDGNTSRVCLISGQWSGENPQCRVIDCGLLPNISMGNVLYINGSTLYQSLVVYECVPGYLLTRGNGERTCLVIGRWSGVPPVCIVNSILSAGANDNAHVVGIVELSVGVSVGGFFLAVIIVSIILLIAVHRFHKRGRDKVYGVDRHSTWAVTGNQGPEPVSLSYARPLYGTVSSIDRLGSSSPLDVDLETRSTDFPLSETSRPTYANLHRSSSLL